MRMVFHIVELILLLEALMGGDFVRACGYGELVYFNGRILTIYLTRQFV